MRICLDAGHYGKYNRSKVVPSYYESEMNWKLHNYLAAELERYGISVTKTRSDPNKDLGLVARGKKAAGCDLFLSIHSNAASAESVDYPLVITMQDGKGDALGNKIAKCIESLMETTQKGKITKKRGTFGGEWYSVLEGARQVGVMGLIIEHSFHTNTKAAQWLLSDSNLQMMAALEAQIIAKHFGMSKKEESASNAAAVLYRVQVGAYAEKANAEAMLAKVKAAGFADAFIVEQKNNTAAAPDTQPEQPAKKSVDEIAREVINGDWGNGDERKQRLQAAGYDYAEVQQRVNELVKGRLLCLRP